MWKKVNIFITLWIYKSQILDADGVEYKRNITHVKKFLEKHDDPQEVKPNDVKSKATTDDDEKIEMLPSDTEKPGIVEPEHDIETTSRPQRTRNIPLRFQDYVMGKWQLCSDFLDWKGWSILILSSWEYLRLWG